jgi:hypothetical protein
MFIFQVFIPTASAQGLAQLAQCSGPDCGTCNVMYMANGIIIWLIGFLFLIFAILVMRAGIKLVVSAGNPSALTSAKESFTNAIIGFIIILAAWLIVDTLMRALVGTPDNPGQLQVEGSRTGFLFWSEVQCTSQIRPQYCDAACQIEVELLANSDHGLNVLVSTPPSVVGTGGEQSVQPVTSSSVNCPAAAESSVITIPGTSYKALPEIANNFVLMRDAARVDGIDLVVTSGWRSEERQVELYNQLSGTGQAVARPCSLGGGGSNHNSGQAIDIRVGCSNGQRGCNTATYNWLKSNGGRFGFYNNLPSDPVHWSVTGY